MQSRVSRDSYPTVKSRYLPLVVALLLIGGFAVLFYVNMFSGEEKTIKVESDISPKAEKTVIENVENEKQEKALKNNDGKEEHFSFYKTLTKDSKKPSVDPTYELAAGKGIPKEEDLSPKPAKNIQVRKSSREPLQKKGSGVFAVQISSFKDFEHADTLLKKLKGKGYSPYIVVASDTDADKTRYKVRLGKYRDREGAKALSKKIKTEQNLDSMVVKE